jgi:hypothetical protein
MAKRGDLKVEEVLEKWSETEVGKDHWLTSCYQGVDKYGNGLLVGYSPTIRWTYQVDSQWGLFVRVWYSWPIMLLGLTICSIGCRLSWSICIMNYNVSSLV